MRLTAFASRNTKEILRDPLTFCFGLGFPVVLLLLLSAINSAIPEQAQMTMFNIDKLTPGITVFGMSFISLFSSMLIAKDRTTSFMMRLFTSPLKAHEFIIGYTLPLLPMAILQSAVCVVVAFFLGLEVSVNILLMLAVNIPIAIVFISLGLLLGTLLNERLSAESAVHCSQTFRHGFQTFGSILQWSAVGSKTLQTHFRLPMP